MGTKILKNTTQCIVAVLIVLIANHTHGADTYKMKIGVVTQNDPIHFFAEEYKKRIEAATDGRIKAQVFPGAQLGSVPRLIEGAQFGTIEMIVFPPGFLKGVNPAFQVLDAPGLFSDMKHAHEAATDPEFRESYLKLASDKGLTGISVWSYGPTSYASLSPIRTLADFKGMKIRVIASKVEIGLMDSVGAVGVPMPFTEITPGMQRKTIDGVRSSIVVLGSLKLYSVAKYITQAKDSILLCVGLVSNAFLDGLPDDLKKNVFDVGRELEDHMLGITTETNIKAVDTWKENGAEVIVLSDEERKEFMKKGAAIADEVLGEDPQIQPTFELLKKVADKHR